MIAILISFIQTLAYILNILILIRVLLSWIPAAQNNRLAVLISRSPTRSSRPSGA
jgi:uncharacterized protein YggT (Ycf19 family)